MMSRLVVVLALGLMISYAEAKKGSKCAKPAKGSGMSQVTLFPPAESSGGQFYGAGVKSGAASACNCTKGQEVYNLQGNSNSTIFGNPHVRVSCNNTKDFCMRTLSGKKYKLKRPTNLFNPPVRIFAYTNPKGKTVNLAVLHCRSLADDGNSTIVFNKKAGFNKKWNCGKQHGSKGTKAAPDFNSKKGKKYLKVAAVSCSGCKNLKKCKVPSVASG